MEDSNNISAELKERIKPFLEAFTDRLLSEFEKEGLISKIISNGVDTNHFKLGSRQLIDQATNDSIQKDSLNDLFELKNLARSVFYNLKDSDSNRSNDLKFTQVLSKLQERGAIDVPWVKSKNIIQAFDNLDSLTDNDGRVEVSRLVEENKINFNELTLKLLEFYGKYKAQSYFSDYNFKRTDVRVSADLIITNSKKDYPDLIFEFKFRKKGVLPSREIVLRSLREIERLNSAGISSYFFLVFFTKQETGSFEKERLRYIRMMEGIDINAAVKENLKFIPISLSNLNLIDDEFEKFKNDIIELNERFNFRSQIPPKNQPDRNDHFFDRTFEFKRNTFEIAINPGTTKYWRLGFKFSRTEQFPLFSEDRHASSTTVDIHLAVGDLEGAGDNRTWINPERLGVAVYNIQPTYDDFSGISDYTGQSVVFKVRPNDDGSVTEFEVQIGGQRMGKKILDLREFNYCRIHAWCDYAQFSLDTEIKVTHKGIKV